MTVDNEIRALGDDETRAAKYDTDQLAELGKKGQAFKNANGDWSYPIADREDASNAIHAVGRGGVSHNAIRAYIIRVLHKLGFAEMIPANWGSDGSITGANAEDDPEQEQRVVPINSELLKEALGELDKSERADTVPDSTDEGPMKVCPTCDGSGKTPDLDAPCPDCDGTGSVERSEKPKYSLRHTIEARKAKLPKRGEREVRTLPLEKLTISASQNRAFDGDDNEGLPLLRFSGYASVFDKRYSVGPYEETIAPGAFKRSLSNPNLDCVLRIEHEDLPLARTTGSVTLTDGSEARTLTLSEDATGLRVEALLDPEDPDVQRLVPKFRRGDLKEMSFAFRCNDDVWSDDYGLRTIRSAEIHRGDVAIVTYGASPTTTSELRSEKMEAFIHRYGFERFMDAMVEWRDWTLMSPEERAGKSISSTNASFLQEMLDLFAAADEAVDEGQARLSDFLGVANPDASDGDEPDGGDASDEDDDAAADESATSDERTAEVIDITPRDSEFLLELRALGGGR